MNARSPASIKPEGADPLPHLAELDAWLQAREARVANLRPGLEQEVVWADPLRKTKTRHCLVYLHGFSASKGEIRPVPDRVAGVLGANLFYTRLEGHGADGAALGAATARGWLDDAAEALRIGAALGEKIVIMATSTGATLATLLLAREDVAESVAAVIFVSPNFGLKSKAAFLLDLPFAAHLLRLAVGEERLIEPMNPDHELFWTNRYPSRALLPMASLVRMARGVDVRHIRTPALFHYATDDLVVDARRTHTVHASWGGPKAKAHPSRIDDPYRHVIAGSALSPSGTDEAVDTMTRWLKSVLAS